MTNPERFRREYFENGKKLDTKYLRFGKGFAKLMEDICKNPELLKDRMWVMTNFGMDIDSSEWINFSMDLKWYDRPEHEMRCDIMGVPMLAYIDSYDSKTSAFMEYKTGKHPWTQAKVQKHDQLVVYATMLKFLTGIMPEYCDLVWIETKDEKGESVDFWRETESNKINITGKIVYFRREFDSREVDRMESLIQRTAEEISDAYQEFVKEI